MFLIGTEYIFGMSRPVWMKIQDNQKCLQIIPSLFLIHKTSIPTSWAVQRDIGLPRFWEHITEQEFDDKLWEVFNLIK